MRNEALILGIDQSIIDTATKKVEGFEGRALEYVVPALDRMRVEQPNLFGFFNQMLQEFEITYPNVYALGSALTFDMIPEERKKREVSKDIIGVAAQALFESTTYDEEQQYLDAIWLYHKLEKDSPDFNKWLRSATNDMQEDTQVDFITGAVVILLPVYMMNESANLQARFFPPEK